MTCDGKPESETVRAGDSAEARPFREGNSGAGNAPDAPAADLKGTPTAETDPATKPTKPRGPKMHDRGGYLRETGFWIRKAHREWKGEPFTPGRAQAMAVLLRTGAAILEGRETDAEREEAEELHKLMLELKKTTGGGFRA